MPLPPWESVREEYQRLAPNTDLATIRRHYEAQRELDQERARESQATSEPVGTYLARRSVPFYSTLRTSLGEDAAHRQAVERINSGYSRPGDMTLVAEHERNTRLEQERGWVARTASDVAHVPAMVGEALIGGAVLGEVAPALARAPGLLSQGARASRGAFGLATAATAARTALTPAMYLPGAAARARSQGGDVFSPENIGPAFLMGFAQTAILGSIPSFAERIPGSGVSPFVQRLAARTFTGMVEQQGVDLLTGAVDNVLPEAAQFRTRYGLLGDALRGEWGHAGQHAATQAVTFAAFSALHPVLHGEQGPEVRRPNVMEAYGEALKELRSRGLSAEAASRELSKIMDPILEATKSGEDPALALEHVLKHSKFLPSRLPIMEKLGEALVATVKMYGPDVMQGGQQASLSDFARPEAKGPQKEADLGSVEANLAQMFGVPESQISNAVAGSNVPLTREATTLAQNTVAPRTQSAPEAHPNEPQLTPERPRTPEEQRINNLVQSELIRTGERPGRPTPEEAQPPTETPPEAVVRQPEPPVEPMTATAREKKLAQLTKEQAADAVRIFADPKKRTSGAAADIPGEVQKHIDESSLPKEEKAALALVLGGASYRNAGPELGISRTEVMNRSRDAFAKLKEENPSFLPEHDTIADWRMDIQLAQKEKLKADFGDTEIAGKATQEDVLDLVVRMEEETSLYAKEIEHDRRQTIIEGHREGVPPEQIQRDVNAAVEEALKVASLQRSDTGPPQTSTARIVRGAKRPGTIYNPIPDIIKAVREWLFGIEEVKNDIETLRQKGYGPSEQRIQQVVGEAGEAGRAGATKASGRTYSDAEVGAAINSVVKQHSDLDGGIVGIKKEMTEADRARHGLEQAAIDDPLGHAFPELSERVLETIAADPARPEKLVDYLKKNPRNADDFDKALLVKRRVDVENALDAAVGRLDAARRSGDPVETAVQETAYESLLKTNAELLDVIEASGSNSGRALNAHKLLANRDFSLARMLTEATIAKGSKLTEGEYDSVVARAKEIDQLQKIKDPTISQQYRLDQHRKEHVKQNAKWNLAKKPMLEKSFAVAGDTADLIRTLLLGLDLPPTLRQGAMFTFSHPIKSGQAFLETFKAFASKEKAFEAKKEIEAREYFKDGTFKRAGIDFTETDGHLSRMEETAMSRWIGEIPVFAGLARANTAYMNRIRADLFEILAHSLGKTEKLTDAEALIFGNMVNISTGRKGLGSFQPAARALAQVFMAPDYLATRFKLLFGQPLYHKAGEGSGRVRLAIAKEYGRAMIGLAVVYGLAKLLGADLEDDPRSTDFGKIKIGNTRLDPLGGVQQGLVLLAREGSGSAVTETGHVRDIRGENRRFGRDDGADVLFRFLRGKLAPLPGAGVNLAAGSTLGGEPSSLSSEALRLITPLSVKDIYQGMNDLGVPGGTATSIWALFGGGTQTYQEKTDAVKFGTALNDLREDKIAWVRGEGRNGAMFPRERDLQILQAFSPHVTTYQHLLRGDRHLPNGQYLPGEPPNAETQARYQEQMNRFAKTALERIRR